MLDLAPYGWCFDYHAFSFCLMLSHEFSPFAWSGFADYMKTKRTREACKTHSEFRSRNIETIKRNKLAVYSWFCRGETHNDVGRRMFSIVDRSYAFDSQTERLCIRTGRTLRTPDLDR